MTRFGKTQYRVGDEATGPQRKCLLRLQAGERYIPKLNTAWALANMGLIFYDLESDRYRLTESGEKFMQTAEWAKDRLHE